MKKILHVVDSLDRGGQETFLLDLAITQKSMDYTVLIVCLFKGGILVEKAKENGITVNVVNKPESSTIKMLSYFRKLITGFLPDTIHTHNRRPLIMTILAAPHYARKTINTRHGNGVRGLYWSAAAIFSKGIINVSDDLFQQSNWLNRVLLKAKNSVIKNGILINDKISTGNNIGKILIVGRLNPVKNHLFALQIIQECVHQGLPVSLDVIGDGPCKQDIEKQITTLGLQQSVTLLGDRNDVQELLAKADLFLLTSFSEGHSIALLEACAAGLPAVVSNVGGNGEIIQNGLTGYVRELDSITSIVNDIKNLISDRSLRKKMSGATRQWVTENASMEKCAREYSKVYNLS
jgi:glycosyltransferase involved in cell wall biosynthesis